MQLWADGSSTFTDTQALLHETHSHAYLSSILWRMIVSSLLDSSTSKLVKYLLELFFSHVLDNKSSSSQVWVDRSLRTDLLRIKWGLFGIPGCFLRGGAPPPDPLKSEWMEAMMAMAMAMAIAGPHGTHQSQPISVQQSSSSSSQVLNVFPIS